jgi:hypothetical protein
MRAKYGVEPEHYAQMLAAQGGVCALCGRAGVRKLCVDHCHTTGQVRGLLCDACNTSIGKLGDTAEALQRVADYLRGAA